MKRELTFIGLCIAAIAFGAVRATAREDEASADAASTSLQRPSAHTIRVTTDEILADPRFRPHKTLAQWFREQMRGWEGRDLNLGGRWVSILLWAFMAWCAVTIVAILAHIGWTLFAVLRPAGNAVSRRPEPAGLSENLCLPYARLVEKARDAADCGHYRAAVHWTMLALLRCLADSGSISLHPSKTNGDYVREFSQTTGPVDRMADFAEAFDRCTYGGRECGQGEFLLMFESLEHLRQYADAQAKL